MSTEIKPCEECQQFDMFETTIENIIDHFAKDFKHKDKTKKVKVLGSYVDFRTGKVMFKLMAIDKGTE